MLDDAARDAQPDGLEPVTEPVPSASEPPFGSLADDVSALIEDGKTYIDAELAFQKSRAGYAGNQTKQSVIYAMGALAFLHLALIGLVIGLIMAIEPYLTAFGATAVVVGVLLIGAAIFGRLAGKRLKALGNAFASGDDERS